MNNSFYALVLRMKYIDRWGLMRNTFSDNLAEHSLDTAILAHALCLIGNEYFGKSLDPERAAVLALFHDAGEIITGDMPTPIKYRSEALRGLYREVEDAAAEDLVSRLPDRLRPHYWSVFAVEDSPLRPYVKAADKLSAYIKCLQETQSGNRVLPCPGLPGKGPPGAASAGGGLLLRKLHPGLLPEPGRAARTPPPLKAQNRAERFVCSARFLSFPA